MSKKTEALKLALEALEELKYSSSSHAADDIYYKAITAIREALAEQPAPPPECQTEAEKTAFAFGWWKALEENRKQPAQHKEPVAYIRKDQLQKAAQSPMLCEVTPEPRQDRIGIHTSPPASKPLTDEQIMEMYNEPRSDAEMITFARAIEAAHGIKGEA